jgi:hypothetical protein
MFELSMEIMRETSVKVIEGDAFNLDVQIYVESNKTVWGARLAEERQKHTRPTMFKILFKRFPKPGLKLLDVKQI